jgi:hypothetical protein
MWYIRVMRNNIILSVDGDYEFGFEASIYFNYLQKFYKDSGFEIKKATIDQNASLSSILDSLLKIYNSHDPRKKSLWLINGGFVHKIIEQLKDSNQIANVNAEFAEISRVYEQINHKFSVVNVFLTDSKLGTKDVKIVSNMTINVRFDFQIIDTTNNSFIITYRKLLDILKCKGWETPPPLLLG